MAVWNCAVPKPEAQAKGGIPVSLRLRFRLGSAAHKPEAQAKEQVLLRLRFRLVCRGILSGEIGGRPMDPRRARVRRVAEVSLIALFLAALWAPLVGRSLGWEPKIDIN